MTTKWNPETVDSSQLDLGQGWWCWCRTTTAGPSSASTGWSRRSEWLPRRPPGTGGGRAPWACPPSSSCCRTFLVVMILGTVEVYFEWSTIFFVKLKSVCCAFRKPTASPANFGHLCTDGHICSITNLVIPTTWKCCHRLLMHNFIYKKRSQWHVVLASFKVNRISLSWKKQQFVAGCTLHRLQEASWELSFCVTTVQASCGNSEAEECTSACESVLQKSSTRICSNFLMEKNIQYIHCTVLVKSTDGFTW